MKIGELIIQEGKKAGLSQDVTARILVSATRELLGNVPEENWEKQGNKNGM